MADTGCRVNKLEHWKSGTALPCIFQSNDANHRPTCNLHREWNLQMNYQIDDAKHQPTCILNPVSCIGNKIYK
jgi:hypothetical protein